MAKLKTEPPIVVLVTGAGAPGIRGTIFALRQNADRIPLRIVGTDLNAGAIGQYMVDSFYQLPAPEDDDYCNRLIEICKTEHVRVVLPHTTRETALLSERAEVLFNNTGTRVATSSPRAIAIANSKFEILEVFRRLGLPHPNYVLTRSEHEFVTAVTSLGYPKEMVVVKPPVSNGMRGFRVLTETPWSLEQFLTQKPSGTDIRLESLLTILRRGNRWPELLVTEHLPGVEYSVDGFRKDQIAVAVPRRRDSIRSGISFENTIIRNAELIRITMTAAEDIGIEYAFGFQYKEDRYGVPKVLECNPRIQGTMVASVFAGVNPVWLSVKACLKWPISPNETEVHECRFCRYWGGIGLVNDSAVTI